MRMIASHGCTSPEFSIYLNKMYVDIHILLYVAIGFE